MLLVGRCNAVEEVGAIVCQFGEKVRCAWWEEGRSMEGEVRHFGIKRRYH